MLQFRGMTTEFFIRNRAALAKKIGGIPIVICAYTLLQRSGDAAFHFEQEANFWYLTGIESPNWTLVIHGTKEYLIAPEVSEVHQLFEGSLSTASAKKVSGVQYILSASEGETLLDELAGKSKAVATIGEDQHVEQYDFALNPGPVEMLKKLRTVFGEVEDCRHDLAILRAIKTPEEIQLIRNAIQLTINGFDAVRNNIHHYSFEYEIEAEFTHYFRKNGATGHAYDPIVATGKNACTLHYVQNQAALNSGEYVLLDIGARLDGYAADITRTYAYGQVSERHQAVHAAVESAHVEIIALLRPGLSVKEYFKKVDDIMTEALRGLGLLNDTSDYRKYFPHSISHGLGIDVHDSLGGPDVFAPGMVLTVEPGIYIPEEGIGVRIEDDILITEVGHENLSARLPTSL